MSEWWTYNPAELLMFSPSAYWRLVERYQRELWPGPLVAFVLGLLAWGMAARGARRGLLVLLAVAWAWVGWAFHATRYAEIFLGGVPLGVACGVQGLMLLGALAAAPAPGRWPFLGHALAAGGIVLYPLLAPLSGRPWAQAEVFGWMPDPTALATIGLLLMAPPARAWLLGLLCVIPVLMFGWGMGTRWAMAG